MPPALAGRFSTAGATWGAPEFAHVVNVGSTAMKMYELSDSSAFSTAFTLYTKQLLQSAEHTYPWSHMFLITTWFIDEKVYVNGC